MSLPPLLPAYDENTFFIHRQSFAQGNYLKALVAAHRGSQMLATGAGRIFRDLMADLPSISNYEPDKAALCYLLADLVYPLCERLLAQAVELTITISSVPVLPPSFVDALATYAAFDTETGIVQSCFMRPEWQDYDVPGLSIKQGMTVLCEPLNYNYHALHEDRPATPISGASNLPNQGNRSVDTPEQRDALPPYWYSGTPDPKHPPLTEIYKPAQLPVGAGQSDEPALAATPRAHALLGRPDLED